KLQAREHIFERRTTVAVPREYRSAASQYSRLPKFSSRICSRSMFDVATHFLGRTGLGGAIGIRGARVQATVGGCAEALALRIGISTLPSPQRPLYHPPSRAPQPNHWRQLSRSTAKQSRHSVGLWCMSA